MPIAIAPLGKIMKLVLPVSEGTRINSTLMITRGNTAMFMFLR